ncbi:MAG: septum formation initiator family protein [Gemmatimonadaceae bacterium]
MPLTTQQIVGRVILAAIGLSVIVFAIEGGEYGTTDLLRQRDAIAHERAVVDSLVRRVAELEAYKAAVESDPLTQERIAREEFGMVKGSREVLYRFAEPADSIRRR